jgi:hypothetical protein
VNAVTVNVMLMSAVPSASFPVLTRVATRSVAAAGTPGTVSVSGVDPTQPAIEVAVTVKLNTPVTVGVPARSPAGLRVTPAGGAPAVTANV